MKQQASEMREIMGERGDLLLAQGIGDVGHDGLGADALAVLEIMQRLDEIFLALAGETRDGLGAGEAVGMA